ncbi:MAG: SRPBCC family protein [Candidatus Eisenbacteria bacterium]
MHHLEREACYPRGLEEVFGFFADAGNLEAITPPWLRFRILTPLPIEMRVGALIDYRLSLHGVPIRWRTEITSWEPPHRFVDEQRRGPYRFWRHEHAFEAEAGVVRVRDRVQYAHLGGPLLQALLIEPDLRRIFDYRMEVIASRLG